MLYSIENDDHKEISVLFFEYPKKLWQAVLMKGIIGLWKCCKAFIKACNTGNIGPFKVKCELVSCILTYESIDQQKHGTFFSSGLTG